MRLVSLEEAAGGDAAAAVSYDCGGVVISVRFAGEEAQVTLDETSHALFRTPSASGVRYESADGEVVVWEHGEDLRVEAPGQTYPECRRKGS